MGYACAGAVEVRNLLSKSLGMELPSTVVFDYPTIVALTDFCLAFSGTAASSAPAAMATSELAFAAPDSSARVPVSAPDSSAVKGKVMAVLSDILGADIDEIQPLSAAGLDSLAAVEVRNELARYTKCILYSFCISMYKNSICFCHHDLIRYFPQATIALDLLLYLKTLGINLCQCEIYRFLVLLIQAGPGNLCSLELPFAKSVKASQISPACYSPVPQQRM